MNFENVTPTSSEKILSIDSKKFDTRKVLNRADSYTFENDFIQSLKNEGLTIEQIDELEVPVFKYRTQITVHGIFDTNSFYMGGYKSCIVNENGSLGLKYCAIDTEKKRRLKNVIALCGNSMFTRWNSLNFSVNKTFEFTEAGLLAARELANNIDTDLFYGFKQIFKCNYAGMQWIEVNIYINGFYECDFWKLATNLTGKTESEYLAIKEQRKKEQEARDLAYKIQAAKDAEEAAKKLIENKERLSGLQKWDGIFRNNEVIIRANKSDYEPFIVIRLTLENNWFKVLREGCKDYENYKFRSWSKPRSKRTWNEQLSYLTGDYYILNPGEPAKNTVVVKKEAPQPAKIENIKIEVIQYSEKAVAIFGDTKAIKEHLKQIGARFNPFLNYNGSRAAGWILPKTSESKLSFINS